MLTLAEILEAVKEASPLRTPPKVTPRPPPPPDPEDHPVDLSTIVAITHKLLSVSRGEAEPDERDALYFRKVYAPEDQLRERVAMDSGHLRRTALRRLSRQRNLSQLPPGFFTGYGEGILFGNPLASPLEEINPLHITEQSRRISQFGVGGVPGAESITQEAMGVQPSVFGFTDPIAGPESSHIAMESRASHGTKLGADGKIYQQLKDRRTGQVNWISPDQLQGKTLGLPA